MYSFKDEYDVSKLEVELLNTFKEMNKKDLVDINFSDMILEQFEENIEEIIEDYQLKEN